jgi:plasmid stabilization system protein ParE
VYEVNLFDEARTTLAGLPPDALKSLAELFDLLAIQPYAGRLYGRPSSDLRTIALADGRILAVWLVLEDQQRVEILRILWLGDTDGLR